MVHQDVLVQQVNCAYRTISPFGDNTSAVAWTHKGSATSDGPVAYLLRLHSLHQRHFQYLSKSEYIPGVYNTMADDLSRFWHLSDSQLLSYFQSHYPQEQPWTIVHLRPEMRSGQMSALRMKRADLQSVLNVPPPKMAIGVSGQNFARPLPSTPSLKPSPTSYLLPFDYDADKLPPMATPSALGRWKTTYVPSARRSPAWGAGIRA